jgi:excinuclease ABC subunit C
LFFMRDGQLARRDAFLMQDAEGESDRAVLASFVKQFYARASDIPTELLLPDELDEADNIAEWLRQAKGRRVELIVPRRGEKRRIVELATRNARDTLEQQKAEWLADSEKSGEAALQLQEALGLPRPPRRIECYDISHVQGTNQVASMVVFEDGKAKRSDYKRFRIKHDLGNNDFASMQEVIRRRFTRALAATPGTERMGVAPPEPDAFAAPAQPRAVAVADDAIEPYPHPVALQDADRGENGPLSIRLPLAGDQALPPPQVGEGEQDAVEEEASEGESVATGGWAVFPDLVIVDGGKGQLSAAVEVMNALELSEIPIVGLAKQREEIFLKDRSDPVLLPRNAQALFLVQRVRDEAHRFAVTYHRKVRGKRGLRSQLEDVPGVGPARKKALLRHFGSVKAMRAASIDELAAVPGMTRRTAEELKRSLAE